MRSASSVKPAVNAVHVFAVVILLAVIVLHPAHASNILDDIGKSYQGATSQWQGKLIPIAKSLFLKLALLEVTWSAIWWVINRNEPDQLLGNLVKKIMGLGFFWAILLNFQDWIPGVINSFSQAGQQAGGIGALTPSTVLDTGLQLTTRIFDKVSFSLVSPEQNMTALTAAFAGFLILLAFVVIAGQMLVTLIESYVAISAGVLFLGFAGSRWTTTFAEKYISYCVSVGVKLFVTYLIIGLGQSLSGQWLNLLVDGMKARDYLPVVGASIVYMFLAWQIPSMASSMLSGTVSMTLGGAAATAASVGTAAAGAVGMAAASVGGALAAGKGVAGAATGVAQLAQAATGAASAGGASGPMSMVTGAIGAVGGAAAGAIKEGIKGLGASSGPGQMAQRVASASAAGADNKALSAAGNVPAPSGGQASGAASPSSPPAPGSSGAAQGQAAGGRPANAGSSVPVPASSQSPVIDTSTSVSQAVQQRDAAAAAQPSAPDATNSPSAATQSATAGGGADAASGSATYPTNGAPPAAPADTNKQTQLSAPRKTTLERMADGAKAMSQTPNDSAAGQGVQIDMKHHRD